jgi:hypothetical protein
MSGCRKRRRELADLLDRVTAEFVGATAGPVEQTRSGRLKAVISLGDVRIPIVAALTPSCGYADAKTAATVRRLLRAAAAQMVAVTP